jgi:cytohesin
MVDLLLRSGANPAKAHPEGETPLLAAARSGSVPAVRLLLARGVDVNHAETFQNTTALMWAAAEGHIDVVDLLIEAGADPNRQGHITSLTERHNADHPTGGFTALMFAARAGNDALVRRLVAKGANVNLKNGDGASAAMVAMYNDRFDVAGTLIELGSDPNDGSLYVAAEMRDATIDQFAFDGSRRRPNHENKLTALDLMRTLLDRGADPNQRFQGQFHSTHMPNTDRFDNTPFFRAAEGDGRAWRQARSDAAGRKGTRAEAWRYLSWGASRQSECRPHAGDGGDDRWARTRDDRRAGLHS